MLRLVKVTLYVVTGVRRLAILMHNRRTLRWLHHCEDLRETLPILIIEKSDKKWSEINVTLIELKFSLIEDAKGV